MHKIPGIMLISAVMLVSAAACGASSKQVKQATAAEYNCDYREVFETATKALKEQFPPLEGANPENGAIVSAFRWHDPYGKRLNPGAAIVGEGYLSVAGEALVKRTDDGWKVLARVRVLGHVVGSPRGEEYKRSDARWPGWADSKLDGFYIKIYERLGGCHMDAPTENE